MFGVWVFIWLHVFFEFFGIVLKLSLNIYNKVYVLMCDGFW